MAVIFIFLALLLAVGGALSLTNATLGVGLIGLGAVCGILARLIQADAHHKETMRLLNAPIEPTTT